MGLVSQPSIYCFIFACRLLNYDLNLAKKTEELAFVYQHNIEDALELFVSDNAKETDCEILIQTWTTLAADRRKMALETIMKRILITLGYRKTMKLLENLPKEKGTFSPG